jgi:C4-dicarboxylate-specific signal transduction histidine kinase
VALAKVVQTASQWARAARRARARSLTKLEADLFVLGLDGRVRSVIGNLIDFALDAVRDVARLVFPVARADDVETSEGVGVQQVS